MHMDSTLPDDVQRIVALVERIGRLLDADAHESGLLPVHWEVLRYLDRANRFSRSPAALTAYLGSTKGTVSQTVKTLQEKDLVRTEVDPKDRRRRKLSLTSKGRRQLAHDPLRKLAEAVGSLRQGARTALKAGLEQVLSARLAAEGRQRFGQCRGCRYFAKTHPQGGPHFCELLQEELSAAESGAICYEQVAG
jgi:DNA-binding MarR family transcriptional regulator